MTDKEPTSPVDNELNSFVAGATGALFGKNFFCRYDIQDVVQYISDPMDCHQEIRGLSWFAYNSNGIVTQTIDYMRALPTLNKVIVKRGRDPERLERNKETMISALNAIRHREFLRDCLYTAMIEGQAVYYCDVSRSRNKGLPRYMKDFEVQRISEISQEAVIGKDIKLSLKALPYGYYRIIGTRNNRYVVAFHLGYFDREGTESAKQKLLKYPKEIRDAYNRRARRSTGNNWVVLDSAKTIVHKIRSKRSEKWGRPLVLAALNNILYKDFFSETKRNILHELNHRVIYTQRTSKISFLKHSRGSANEAAYAAFAP